MQKLITYLLISINIVIAIAEVEAQGTSPVGVNFIIVNFNQPPSQASLSVNVAPLKYNKDFALSMEIDDANLTLFTHGYPVFEGGVVNGSTYPGMTYSDGCGNQHHFKMSSSVFVFAGNNENGPDIHVDNSSGQLSWTQMDTIYTHNWGILNHGVNGNANTAPLFINYSLRRNRSFIRRHLYNVTQGGVITNVFVNPNGNSNWTIPSFNLGNICALNQNLPSPIGENGGDVNAPDIDWTQPQNLYRQIAEDINVKSVVDGLASSSVGGANYWLPIFTHSLTLQYVFANFTSDFNYIANTYGSNGLDNILMTTDEEIQDYLIVRDATSINYVLNGTSLFITYSGEVADNLRFYSSSIVINSDATINNIVVDGASSYTSTGIGETSALINLNWDGSYVIPAEHLADSMVIIATNTQAQYDCWVAMDYVIPLTNGSHKDSLRLVLCNIPNTTYDDGFCDCQINLSPADTTINSGDCIDLFGAVGNYTYQWYIADSLIDTTQNIYKCPTDTTQYNHIATNTYGCPAEDSIKVNINFLSFSLGSDTTICDGNCVTITGPSGMVQYHWFVADTIYDTVQTIYPCPLDTTQYILWVEDTLGATASDSIIVNVNPTPIVNLQPSDTTIDQGACIELYGAVGNYTYQWYIADSLIDTTQNIYKCPTDTTQYNHIATNTYGCPAEDSIKVNINFLSFSLGSDTTICDGNCVTITGPSGMVQYHWFVADTIYDTVQTIYPCPLDTTQYKLTVVNEYGITASDSIIIKLKPIPTVSFESDSLSVNIGNDILLTVTASGGSGNTFSWMYNSDTTYTLSNNYYNLIKPDVSDYVFVKVQAENECTATDSAYLKVLEYPQIIVSNDTTVCSGQPLTLSVSGGDIFLWIVAGDTISTDSTIFVFPVVSTDYIAQTAFAGSVNYSVDTVKVTVYNSTDTKILYDTNTVCKYADVLLTASGADHYLWTPGDDTNAVYNFTIFDTTTIWLTGTNNNGCWSIDSVVFYNKLAPVVSFTGLLSTYCANDPFTILTGTPSDGIFTGSGVVGDKFYPVSAGSGEHAVVYSYTNSEGCTGYDTIITTIYGNGDSIDLGADFILQPDSSKILNAGSGFDNYFWTTGAISQSIVVVGNENPPGTYEYAVMGIINGCSNRGSVNITFENPSGYFEKHINNLIISPNPNNGSFSIIFNTVEKTVQLSIYNLQGQLLLKKDIESKAGVYSAEIKLNNVNPGIYFLSLTTPKSVRTAKIIMK